MNLRFPTLRPLALTLAASSLWSGLQLCAFSADSVPLESQWVVHLDVAQWRETQTGDAILDVLREQDFSEMQEMMPLDPVGLVNGIEAITIYGLNFDFEETGAPEGTVVISGSELFIQMVQGAVAAMEIQQPEMFSTEQVGETMLYGIDGEVYGTFLPDDRVVIGRTRRSVLAHAIWSQNPTFGPSLSALLKAVEDPEFGTHQEVRVEPTSEDETVPFLRRMAPILGDEASFYLLAAAEGINQIAELPPQARIFQLTEGVSVQLGEAGETVDAAIGLMTMDDKTAQQVQQVLQGLVAMATLAQNGNPDLAAVLSTVEVRLEGRSVRMTAHYPVERALGWIDRLIREMTGSEQASPDWEDGAEGSEEAGEAS